MSNLVINSLFIAVDIFLAFDNLYLSIKRDSKLNLFVGILFIFAAWIQFLMLMSFLKSKRNK